MVRAIDGRNLATRLKGQTREFGVDIKMGEGLEVAVDGNHKRVLPADGRMSLAR